MNMDSNRLERVLEKISETRILVFGDYFLDQYWITDPELEETSLETGLPANQVGEVRLSAGAAATIRTVIETVKQPKESSGRCFHE